MKHLKYIYFGFKALLPLALLGLLAYTSTFGGLTQAVSVILSIICIFWIVGRGFYFERST